MAMGATAILAAMAVAVAAAAFILRRLHEWYWERRLGRLRWSRLPPGDMGWPLAGNMPSFFLAFKSGDPDSFVGTFARRYGSSGIYRSFMFASPTIIVSSPEACKRVLMDDDNFTTGWPKSTMELMGRKSFIAITKEEHKQLRRVTAAPVNGPEALSSYLEFIDDTVVSSLRQWSEMDAIPFLTELRKLTFKIIVKIFISKFSDAAMESLEKVYTELNLGIRAMAIDIPGFAYHRALKARRKLVQVLQRVLDERRVEHAAGEARRRRVDMMDNLLAVEDESGNRLSDEQIIDVLIMYLNAGHESSGHITMWATVFLQENPDIFNKAKAEQEEIRMQMPRDQQRLTMKDYRKMEYLSKIIDETLRVVNISFVSFRRATTDFSVNGYLIPKDWKVQLWYRSVHMNPEVYDDPKQFNPSRWDGPPPKAGTFLPFGLGGRLCPGNELAKLEISVFLHHFLLGYKLTRVNPGCRIRYLPHPRPTDNCMARITKIN